MLQSDGRSPYIHVKYMYVYMYVCMYDADGHVWIEWRSLYIHVYMYVCAYLLYIYLHNLFVYKHMHIYIQPYLDDVNAYITYAYAYKHTHTHTYTQTHTYIHTHTHSHIRMMSTLRVEKCFCQMRSSATHSIAPKKILLTCHNGKERCVYGTECTHTRAMYMSTSTCIWCVCVWYGK
jgi:hypothetical protein